MSGAPGRLVLLGHPVGHSLSPAMQNAALRAAGIPLRYELMDIAPRRLEDAVLQLRRERAAGNVTIPHKEAMVALCDRLTGPAIATGAVNTFWTAVDGALVGDNTDVDGFDASARALVGRTAGRDVLLLGAGGGAAAVLVALKRWGVARISVYARTEPRARALIARTGAVATVIDDPTPVLPDITLLINATPIGLRDDPLPADPAALRRDCAVFDLVYRAGETALVRAARARGLSTADGLGMLVEQGALAFERWFGVAPDRDAMWSALPERR